MQPRKYGEGDPRARFILRDIFDGEGARSSHWDVAELYNRKKRRRITGKTAEICEPQSLPAASSSAQPPTGVSADIFDMENKAGQ
jgi:hypothetical protein